MARFFEISIGHYINADFVVEIEKKENEVYLITMLDGKQLRANKWHVEAIMGADDIKSIIPVQGMEIHYLDGDKKTSEPVRFLALTENGSVRAADVGDLFVNFMDEGTRFDGITMNGENLGWVQKGDYL